jgi:hypothetical protein
LPKGCCERGQAHKIHDEEGIPPADQALLFAGNKLDNERALDNCDIKHGWTLDLAKPKPDSKPAAKPKGQNKPGKSYLLEDWKEEPDRFGKLAVTTHEPATRGF